MVNRFDGEFKNPPVEPYAKIRHERLGIVGGSVVSREATAEGTTTTVNMGGIQVTGVELLYVPGRAK